MIDVFRLCRERVSAESAAHRYGLEFDRRGWALCPFHSDKRPSMSFRAGRFRCWACNASRDSIDFAGRLLGLEPLAAVERLNADFGLDLPLHRQPTPEDLQALRRRKEIAEAHKTFEAWRERTIWDLCAVYRMGHMALKAPDNMTTQEAAAVRLMAWAEYTADMLSYGTPEDQIQIFRDRQVIQLRTREILKFAPTKCGAA